MTTQATHTEHDDGFDFEVRVRQQQRRDRARRQACERMRRYRAGLRAKKERAEATRPKRRSIDYRAALFDNANYGVLTLTQRRILDSLVYEHARHFGTRDELIVTYADFVAGKASRRLIKPALTKLEALGVVSVTWGVGGRKGRVANRFRLMFIDGPAADSVTSFGTTSSTDERYARGSQRNARKSPANSTESVTLSVPLGGPLNNTCAPPDSAGGGTDSVTLSDALSPPHRPKGLPMKDIGQSDPTESHREECVFTGGPQSTEPTREGLRAREAGRTEPRYARGTGPRPMPAEPDEQMVVIAAEHGWDAERIEEQWPKFVEFNRAKGTCWADWSFPWRSWVKNGVQLDGRDRQTGSARPTSGTSMVDTLVACAAAGGRQGYGEFAL
jgi:hypothetical protein